MSNKELIEAIELKLKQYADELNQLQTDIESNKALSIKHGKLTLQFALKAGAILRGAKKIIPHGDWEKWVKTNVKGIEIRTAQNYMKLAEMAAETKHVAFLEAAESLREAYIEFGIIEKKETKPKSESDPKMTPQRMKEEDRVQYDAKWNVARQTALTHVRNTIEATKQVNWNLSTWTVKNNKPRSGDETNYGAALFASLKTWVGKREFKSDLTYEDEVTTKAGIVLAEVVKTIILANATPEPEIADAIRNYSLELNPQPVPVADVAPALAPA